jgi:hypothetical protein
MDGYPQAIGERPASVAPGRRWLERITRIKRRRRAHPGPRVDVIERRAHEARLQERAWNYVPDPRWHRG